MILDKNFLSKDNIDFIENYILGPDCPFYVKTGIGVGDDVKTLTHCVLPRPENRSVTYEKHPFWDKFENILINFCQNNNLACSEIFRISINLTYYNGTVEKSPIHIDHDFEHNQLIVYLNNTLDKNCSTVLLNGKDEIYGEVNPEKYMGLCFPKMRHYLKFPKIGERYVLVYTFK
tara:strand:+ start:450 stop:974 length:525 start_codon:yes stop_codon:yes gene_type:complete